MINDATYNSECGAEDSDIHAVEVDTPFRELDDPVRFVGEVDRGFKHSWMLISFSRPARTTLKCEIDKKKMFIY